VLAAEVRRLTATTERKNILLHEQAVENARLVKAMDTAVKALDEMIFLAGNHISAHGCRRARGRLANAKTILAKHRKEQPTTQPGVVPVET
jgi:hypothetical protein